MKTMKMKRIMMTTRPLLRSLLLRLLLLTAAALPMLSSADAAEAEAHPAAAGGAFGVTLYFDFLYNGLKVGEVTETFRADGAGGYELDSHAAASGLAAILYGDVRRHSRGRLDAALGLVPDFYEEQRGPRPRQAAEFDRARGVVTLRRGADEVREEPLAGAAYDYLSAFYLSYVLGRPAAGTLAVTDGWRLKEYGYEWTGTEALRTPLGEFAAERVSRTDGKTRIFWLAKELDYLPARVYVDDKGHVFESVLTGAARPAPGGR